MDPEVKALLEKVKSTADFGYVTFDSINATNALGENALHCACIWGDFEAVKLLVENGIEVNQRGEHGFTPLQEAIEFGFQAIADYLISHGADPTLLLKEPLFDEEQHEAHLAKLCEETKRLEAKVRDNCSRGAQPGAAADAAKRRG